MVVSAAKQFPMGNRANLERFIRYEVEQGLILGPLAVEDLFFETTLET